MMRPHEAFQAPIAAMLIADGGAPTKGAAAGTRPEEVIDSRVGRVKQHIRRYVESGGADGHIWDGRPTLLLTTLGRKTGRLYRSALIYGKHGDQYVVVASARGAARHPSWYLNLLEEPEVTVQVGSDVFTAQAREASANEKPELWQAMTSIFSKFERYQARTKRVIPVVVIERA